MRNARYDRILASTALALVFAAPLSAMAKDVKLAAAPMAAPAEQATPQTAPPAKAPTVRRRVARVRTATATRINKYRQLKTYSCRVVIL